MNRHTATTMRALGFALEADVVENEPATQSAPRQIGAASWDSIAASIRAETGDLVSGGAAYGRSTSPASDFGWDAVAATLIAEARLQNAPVGAGS